MSGVAYPRFPPAAMSECISSEFSKFCLYLVLLTWVSQASSAFRRALPHPYLGCDLTDVEYRHDLSRIEEIMSQPDSSWVLMYRLSL